MPDQCQRVGNFGRKCIARSSTGRCGRGLSVHRRVLPRPHEHCDHEQQQDRNLRLTHWHSVIAAIPVRAGWQNVGHIAFVGRVHRAMMQHARISIGIDSADCM